MIEKYKGYVYFIPLSYETAFYYFPQNVYTVVFDSDNLLIDGAHNGEFSISVFLRKTINRIILDWTIMPHISLSRFGNMSGHDQGISGPIASDLSQPCSGPWAN